MNRWCLSGPLDWDLFEKPPPQKDGRCWSRDIVGMATDGTGRRERHAAHSPGTALHASAHVGQCGQGIWKVHVDRFVNSYLMMLGNLHTFLSTCYFFQNWFQKFLALNTPIATNVVCFSRLLKSQQKSSAFLVCWNRNKSRLFFSSAEMFKKPLKQTVWTQIRLLS